MKKLEELGMCLRFTDHPDQYHKTAECDNWRSDCERKGHVAWEFDDGTQGDKCLDCGALIPTANKI